MINVAVLGYGTVGSGIVEVIMTNKELIEARIGDSIQVKHILDLRKFPGDPYEALVTDDYNVIVNDPEVNIVCEAMGGTKPAYDFTRRALEAGKSVCTSNKAVVAEFGPELMKIAKENNCNYLFGASVGGGIPIIRPLNQSLTADEIMEITGILNGTTNYILSQMHDHGKGFEEALKDAQSKGYAEKNPTADIEGYDACRKIAILASLAYGMQVDFEDIYTEGITKITKEDMQYADALRASIKLFATGKREGEQFFAMIAPRMIRANHPLFSVNDVFNGILVRGNILGDVMFYGSGAGKLPTASAVVADVVDAAKHEGTNIMTLWSNKKLALSDVKDATNTFFVRVPAEQKDAAIAAFGNVNEVNAVVDGEFAFLTESMTEAAFEEAASKLQVISRIRTDFNEI